MSKAELEKQYGKKIDDLLIKLAEPREEYTETFTSLPLWPLDKDKRHELARERAKERGGARLQYAEAYTGAMLELLEESGQSAGVTSSFAAYERNTRIGAVVATQHRTLISPVAWLTASSIALVAGATNEERTNALAANGSQFLWGTVIGLSAASTVAPPIARAYARFRVGHRLPLTDPVQPDVVDTLAILNKEEYVYSKVAEYTNAAFKAVIGASAVGGAAIAGTI